MKSLDMDFKDNLVYGVADPIPAIDSNDAFTTRVNNRYNDSHSAKINIQHNFILAA
jgi:hypothetical protein